MKLSHLKYQRTRQKYRIKNVARFTAIILIVLLTAIALILIKAKNNGNNDGNNSDVVANPSRTPISTLEPTPDITPEPTPTPFPVPEGKTMNPFLVVIDPGHGGGDGGTVSPFKDGLYEKDIVLDISKKVEALLIEKGINVKMTRDKDARIIEHNDKDLVARWSMVNELDASLLVSIHVNAYENAASVNGMEIYYFEDKPEIYTGFTQKRFAEIMEETIPNANGITFRFSEGGVRLALVRNPKMPAVLIETAYITNKEDHKRLESQEFRENTAQGIVDGIVKAMDEIGVFEHEGEMYVFKEIGE